MSVSEEKNNKKIIKDDLEQTQDAVKYIQSINKKKRIEENLLFSNCIFEETINQINPKKHSKLKTKLKDFVLAIINFPDDFKYCLKIVFLKS